MYKLLKIFHLLGLTLFLGSIFGHIVASAGAGEIGGAAFSAARQAIAAATEALTLPGLGLALASGLGLAALAPERRRWMFVHAGLAATVALVAVVVVIPAGQRTLSAATFAEVRAAVTTETVAGALNVALTFAILALGVVKPRLGDRARRRDTENS